MARIRRSGNQEATYNETTALAGFADKRRVCCRRGSPPLVRSLTGKSNRNTYFYTDGVDIHMGQTNDSGIVNSTFHLDLVDVFSLDLSPG